MHTAPRIGSCTTRGLILHDPARICSCKTGIPASSVEIERKNHRRRHVERSTTHIWRSNGTPSEAQRREKEMIGWRSLQRVQEWRTRTSRAQTQGLSRLARDGPAKRRWTSSSSSSSSSSTTRGGESRMEKMIRTIQARYPHISPTHLPSLTAAFVLLHELTALVPLLAIFGIVQTTGTGAKLVHFIRHSLPPPPSSDSDSSDQEPASSSVSQDRSDHPTRHPSIAGSLTQALDDSAAKVSKLAERYGYSSGQEAPEDDAACDEESRSMLENGVLASGLVAYLCVKPQSENNETEELVEKGRKVGHKSYQKYNARSKDPPPMRIHRRKIRIFERT
ncbi:hypothetical protein PGTUg99_009703 [Puccinia graminis f. sp. tritici]|uniref:Uncharacterized protein n=1 Tax=Puccinia graminis f. sp. tritici TaxID=56615 RepID=A0A5B0S543_PUCGR|nr:hypothetical protein PGTUg99_009703 [Puccinia graminis f. sp. tritici]